MAPLFCKTWYFEKRNIVKLVIPEWNIAKLERRINMEEKAEEQVFINERVDNMLKDFEKVLKDVILPIKADTDFINQVLYAPISDETKEKVIGEIHEKMKERVEGYAI